MSAFSSFDASLGGLQSTERFVGVGIRRRAVHGCLSFREFLPGLLEIDVFGELGVLGKDPDLIVQDFEEPADYGEQRVMGSRGIAQNARTQLAQEWGVFGQYTEIAVLCWDFGAGDGFIDKLAFRRCDLQMESIGHLYSNSAGSR